MVGAGLQNIVIITGVETYLVSVEVRPEVSIVSSAGAHRVSPYVLVAIHTDAGISGYGEATVMPVWSGETQASADAAIRETLAPVLIGQNCFAIGALATAMDKALFGNPFTKAAVEMALLDAAGKAIGKPVHTLLGGSRRPDGIALKFSIGAFTPEKAVRVAEYARSLGLRAAKVKVGLEVRSDLERVQAVRDAVGPDFRLGVDANAGWTESETISALPALERMGINVLEQPLRRGDFRGCARLRQRTSIPLLLDESIFTPEDALEAIRADACDLISIYPGKNGGIWRSLAIAQMAATAGIECVIGSNLEWEIASAAMLHLATAIPNLSSDVDHDIIGPLYNARQIGSPPVRYEKGRALVPEGAGLGVAPKPAVLAEAAGA